MNVVLDGDRCSVLQGDCLEVLKELGDASVDAVVTDPPYELGFMNKKWDAGGIAYSVDLWCEVLRVLKPGGHLLAFGGTRTYHRMACAIEDAGFEVRDCKTWNYKTGMPKSLTENTGMPKGLGTGLKPSLEPITVARKPLAERTIIANVEQYGTGAFNIDACRIAMKEGETLNTPKSDPANRKGEIVPIGKGRTAEEMQAAQAAQAASIQRTKDLGRWPANSLFDDTFPDADKHFFCAKPSRKERDLGCEHLTPKTGGEATDRVDGSIGTENTRAGAGRTGGARNHHPTVKPVELMRYLVRLVTPPGGIVLDPFLGSGTTAMAAILEGFNVIGIERETDYLQIITARVSAALGSGYAPILRELSDPKGVA